MIYQFVFKEQTIIILSMDIIFIFYFDKNKIKKKVRDYFLKYLNKNNIGAGVNYRSVTNMTNYKKLFNWKNRTCPVSNNIGLNTVSLPLYPSLTNKEQNYIIYKVREFLKKYNISVKY